MKEFFYFSRGERRGIIVLVALIILVYLSGYLYRYWRDQQPLAEEELRQQAQLMEEYWAFMASLQEARNEAQEKRRVAKEPKRLTPMPFNPNTADSATFVQMGLPDWMARNILKYRNKGGKFRKPEDFRKVYGLTEEQYQILSPYIRVDAPQAPAKTSADLPQDHQSYTTYRDSSYLGEAVSAKQEKYPPGTLIDLNAADTTELKKIPGIGSYIARMITNHRQRLGGFYRIEQLGEIRLKHELLRPWFSIDTLKIQRINVNKSGVEQLRRHPYINFYQAKAIVEYRKLHGDLHSLRPFILHEDFTEADIERISHYVCFK